MSFVRIAVCLTLLAVQLSDTNGFTFINRARKFPLSSTSVSEPTTGKWRESLKFWKRKDDLPTKPENAVLVFGATGKTGKQIVKKLLEENKQIVIPARNETKVMEVFGDLIENENIFVDPTIDLTDPYSVTSELFDGVDQIVSSLGPTFGDPAASSEAIDFYANLDIFRKFKKVLEKRETPDMNLNGLLRKSLVSLSESSRQLERWMRRDDAMVGGRSSSIWSEVDWEEEGVEFARWTGEIDTNMGGFCGTDYVEKFDTNGFDGIILRVRGDGNRYKVRLIPDNAEMEKNEYQYQASFDTVDGQWMDVFMPFDSFVAVKRNQVDYRAPPVNKASPNGRMLCVGLMRSKYAYNEMESVNFAAGSFCLDVEDIALFSAPRPAIVMISSAGTERINKLETEEERKRDIPIVQLNPGGILHWKYKAEEELRVSGLDYAIVRATGLANAPSSSSSSSDAPTQAQAPATAAAKETNEAQTQGGDTETSPSSTSSSSSSSSSSTYASFLSKERAMLASPRRLQFSQGDTISGRITREELAELTVAALKSPYAVGTTFEVRRDETESGKLPSTTDPNNWNMAQGTWDNQGWEKQDYDYNFRKLVKDTDRFLGGVTISPTITGPECDTGGATGVVTKTRTGKVPIFGSTTLLPPFPMAHPPPGEEVSEDRKQEILSDPRVQAAIVRNAE
mmetsp:Transcript_15982/g.26913  ORF Transcript_15982/g.26913 Transcript_15982/m.26913 type:complete len:680 (+) Transcript_15982:106-2145(+)